ncbi:MAG: FkbM family methyltransferase [Pseudomonadota bacterium]
MQLIQGSLLAHPRMVAWRNRLRRNTVLLGVYRLWAGRDGYEQRFGSALLAAVGMNDVVWDIGANVGLYSEKFLQRGASFVVCFEPAPAAIAELGRRFSDESLARRVRVVPAALSNTRGSANFVADGSSPVNKLGGSGPGAVIEVPVLRGDDALAEYSLPVPDVIKVDVEGYELEVIEGLQGVLSRPQVRAVFVEVHFGLLHERGNDHAPATIVALLKNHGFRTSWLDASHLIAHRGA